MAMKARIQSARDFLIRHAALQFEDRSRRGEGADAERIEEIDREADYEIRRTHGAQRTAPALEVPPAADVTQRDCHHDPEQYMHAIQG